MRQLSHHIAILVLAAPAVAAQTPVTSSTFGVAGFDSLTIKAKLGNVAAGGTVSMKAQGGHLANGSDKADIEGAVVVADDTDDSKYLLLEIHRPIDYEYITVTITRAGADSVIEGLEVLMYGASNTPVEQPNVAAVTSLVSPELA